MRIPIAIGTALKSARNFSASDGTAKNILELRVNEFPMVPRTFLIFFISLWSFAFISCNRDPVDIVGPGFKGSGGVYIVNEGVFNNDNSSISFYDYQDNKVYNQVFYSANETPLGDIAQSMIIHKGKAYVVINNSGKVYIMNADDAIYSGKITGLISPRYMHFVNDYKAYITDLYARKIWVYSTTDEKIIGEIDVNNHDGFDQHSTEQMVQYNDYVFVACWSYDNKVLVIDALNDHIVDSITITKQPNSMLIDRFNRIWVLSDGGFTGSAYGQETAALTRIDAENRQVEAVFTFSSMQDSPFDLEINGTGDTVYYLNNGVFRMAVTDSGLPPVPFIPEAGKRFYSLGIDPATDQIYTGDAIDYQQNGMVYRFSPEGTVIDSFRVGINPGAFCFK